MRLEFPFIENTEQVILDSVFAEPELLSDFMISHSFSHKPNYVFFSLAQQLCPASIEHPDCARLRQRFQEKLKLAAASPNLSVVDAPYTLSEF
jgi:hypothetical protein